MLKPLIPGGSLGKLARNIFFIGLFFHLLAAWFTVGYQHPDEYFQVVEFASYKLGITPASALTWEFGAGIRPAIQPAMVYGLCKIANLSNPVLISFLLRLISAIAAWVVAFVFVLISLKECHTDKAKKIILYLSAFLWYIPYIHARFSSENWTAIFFFAGLSMLMLRVKPGTDKLKINQGLFSLLFCGILFGLSFVVRFQSGFMILGLGLWLLIYGKLHFKQLLLLSAGIVISIAAGSLIDRWFYGKWLFTAINYFHVNIMEGKTAEWGTSPWWDYFVMIIENNIPPFSIAILAAIFVFSFRFYKHLLTWVCVPFLLIHIINGHKDLRFIFPLVNALPVVIGLAYDESVFSLRASKLAHFLSSRFAIICTRVFLSVNILLMIIVCVKPANEMFSFYNYMYENCKDRKTYLYTFSRDPYTELHVEFFKPKNLTVVYVSKYSLSHDVSFIAGATNLVFEESLETPDSWQPANSKISLVYQSIPGWTMKADFNNWLQHTRIWSLYKVE